MNKVINIYKIDKQHHELSKSPSDEDKIKFIINKTYQNNKEDKGISKILAVNGLQFYLFVHNFNEQECEWDSFLPNNFTKDLKLQTSTLTLLLFIADDNNNLFVVIGGTGYEAIVKYIDHTFGLLVLSKLINPEDIIHSISSRGLTGKQAGISEQYRNDFRLTDYVRFGKVPKEIDIELNTEMSNEYFKFLKKDELDKINIYAGKSFRIKKLIDFKNLCQIICSLGKILKKESKDYVSTYKEIKDVKEKQELTNLLIRKIFDDVADFRKSKQESYGDRYNTFKFDLCNPNKISEFYSADYYVITYKNEEDKIRKIKVENREKLYETFVEKIALSLNDFREHNFRAFINKMRVLAYVNDKKPLSAGFIHHFTTELNYNNKPVFVVDTKWYYLNSLFIDDLKNECVQVIKNNKIDKDILYLPWDKTKQPKEREYNLLYQNIPKYFVLDTIVPDLIELCDIMYVDNNEIYLIHVKYGFDAALRELDNQISLSAKRLYDDIKSNKFDYISKMYDKANDLFSNTYTKDEFIDLFKKNRIIYVFAFATNNKNMPVEDNIESYKSNIAKYSIIKCIREMRTYNYDIKVCQINS